jgi:hypothetical protein
MAMTKTVTLRDIIYTPARFTPKDPLTEPAFVWAHYEINIDDPDDDQLPIVKNETRRFKVGDDVSNEDILVQNVFNAVFNA